MSSLDKLLAVVDAEIGTAPVSELGLQWCALPQAELAERAGLSLTTVERTLRGKQKHLVKFICRREGTLTTLLRRADGKTTPAFRAVIDQRLMATEFKKATGQKTVPPKAYGCLMECVKAWPEGHRLPIFRYILRHWTVFMASYKFSLSLAPEGSPEWKRRFLQFPNLYVLADGRAVALDCYITHLQEQGKGCD